MCLREGAGTDGSEWEGRRGGGDGRFMKVHLKGERVPPGLAVRCTQSEAGGSP